MCFKGTINRPSSLAISQELDSMGATNNAFTSEEVTGYWAKARTHQFDRILDIVSDLYLNPLLPAQEIEKERGVIIEEINMYEDLPQRTVHDVLDALMYREQSAGRPIIGSKENIKAFKRNDFIRYRTRHYTAPKTCITVSGDIDPASALRTIKKLFKNIQSGVYLKRKKTKESQRAPMILSKYKKTDQTHFLLGFRSCTLSDKQNPIYDILATVLGQGMSSRLFQKLREEMGVCYYVRAGNQTATDTGIFKIASGVTTERFEEVVKEILKELNTLKNNLISKEELTKAKEFIIGTMLMGLESSDELADWYGGQEIFHRPIKTPEKVIEEIERVTEQEVQTIARKVFRNTNLNLAFIGPNKITSSLKKNLTL
jgi:predicted Zn-dependent peptidase